MQPQLLHVLVHRLFSHLLFPIHQHHSDQICLWPVQIPNHKQFSMCPMKDNSVVHLIIELIFDSQTKIKLCHFAESKGRRIFRNLAAKKIKNNRFKKDTSTIITPDDNSSNGVVLYLRPIQDEVQSNEENINPTSIINLSWFNNDQQVIPSSSVTNNPSTSAPNSAFFISPPHFEDID